MVIATDSTRVSYLPRGTDHGFRHQAHPEKIQEVNPPESREFMG